MKSVKVRRCCDSSNHAFVFHCVYSPKASEKKRDEDSILLSVVIPAYNEEKRISVMLDAALNVWLPGESGDKLIRTTRACGILLRSEEKAENIDIEWIIVNDGSSDATAQTVRDYVRKQEAVTGGVTYRWRLISLRKNGGKGAAVRAGMIHARGQLCLMADADGATDFGVGLQSCLDALLATLETKQPSSQTPSPMLSRSICVFGSRAHMENDTIAKRSLVRTFLMHAFHFFVSVLCSSKVRDSQCGFKLFPQQVARTMFENLHLMRWAFDTELLVLAELERVQILEVAVPWHEVDGSKLNTSKIALLLVSIGMLRDMLCVRLCYSFGIWQLKKR